MMVQTELLAVMSAILAASGKRTAAGSVALARELLDLIGTEEPEAREAEQRRARSEAWGRAIDRKKERES